MVLSTNEVYKIAQAKYEEYQPLCCPGKQMAQAIEYLNNCLVNKEGKTSKDLYDFDGRIYLLSKDEQKDFITDQDLSVLKVKPNKKKELQSIIKERTYGKE